MESTFWIHGSSVLHSRRGADKGVVSTSGGPSRRDAPLGLVSTLHAAVTARSLHERRCLMKLKDHSQSNHEAASEALGNRLKRYGPWRERFPGRRVAQSVGACPLKLNDHLYLPRPLPTASPRAGEAPLTCVLALHCLSSLSIPSFSPSTHARSPRRPTITL